jgi:acetylornithine deacetylase/succinyl-diaminopimelate desuccinylase-like protein
VLDYINKNYERSLGDLSDFLSIPSISAVESRAGDVRRAAEWLLDHMKRSGLDATLYETPGHPVVYAEYCRYPDLPTLLFYAHYDVAPPGSPEEWMNPPFSPTIKDGSIYARCCR